MKFLLSLLILAETLSQGWAYTQCRYSYYDNFRHKTIVTYYRCSSREYCCGSHSCCTPIYSRWYLWFVISTFFFIVFLIWWYYRYRYRPRRAVIANAVPVVTGPTVSARMTTVNAYPSTGPVTVINPNAGVVHYSSYPSYPGPVVNPYPMQAPPPYSVVVPNR